MELTEFLRELANEEGNRIARDSQYRRHIGCTATGEMVAVLIDEPTHGTRLDVYSADKDDVGIQEFNDWTLTRSRTVNGVNYLVTQTLDGTEVLVPQDGQQGPLLVGGEIAAGPPEEVIAATPTDVA